MGLSEGITISCSIAAGKVILCDDGKVGTWSIGVWCGREGKKSSLLAYATLSNCKPNRCDALPTCLCTSDRDYSSQPWVRPLQE